MYVLKNDLLKILTGFILRNERCSNINYINMETRHRNECT